jgi:hypothetical protein
MKINILITFALLVIGTFQSYDIIIQCKKNVNSSCSNYVSFHGGPFNNFGECANDTDTISLCNQLGLYIGPGVVTFSCGVNSCGSCIVQS